MFEKIRLAYSGVLSAPEPLKQGFKLSELINTSINSIVTLIDG